MTRKRVSARHQTPPCLGRNIQLASFDNELGRKARNTNECVLQLLSHRHAFSPQFQGFCRTPDFLEPLAQALCLVHDERLQKMFRRMSALSVESASVDSTSNTPQDGPNRYLSPKVTEKEEDGEGVA
eukprot:CCRYP_000744-RI/>CCRYP_000744-RI protein AED:0.49 eAED:0.49 QI:0/0/0/1/0/0/2/0/126